MSPVAAPPVVADGLQRGVKALIEAVSTADECVAMIRRLADRGIGHLAAWLFPTPARSLDAMVESLVADVIPVRPKPPKVIAS